MLGTNRLRPSAGLARARTEGSDGGAARGERYPGDGLPVSGLQAALRATRPDASMPADDILLQRQRVARSREIARAAALGPSQAAAPVHNPSPSGKCITTRFLRHCKLGTELFEQLLLVNSAFSRNPVSFETQPLGRFKKRSNSRLMEQERFEVLPSDPDPPRESRRRRKGPSRSGTPRPRLPYKQEDAAAPEAAAEAEEASDSGSEGHASLRRQRASARRSHRFAATAAAAKAGAAAVGAPQPSGFGSGAAGGPPLHHRSTRPTAEA